MQRIPIIEVSAARSGGLAARQAIAREIDATCREIGFFTVTGHGVPVAAMDELRSKAHAFFALPLRRSAKQSIRFPARRGAIARKGWSRWRRRMQARRRPILKSSIISAGKAGRTRRTIQGPRADAISYQTFGRRRRSALRARPQLTTQKWKSWRRS